MRLDETKTLLPLWHESSGQQAAATPAVWGLLQPWASSLISRRTRKLFVRWINRVTKARLVLAGGQLGVMPPHRSRASVSESISAKRSRWASSGRDIAQAQQIARPFWILDIAGGIVYHAVLISRGLPVYSRYRTWYYIGKQYWKGSRRQVTMSKKISLSARDVLRKPYARILTPEEDGTYSAQLLEFPGCFAEGDTAAEAIEDLEKAAASWIEASREQGREVPEPLASYAYSGKINLRLPRSIHKQAARFAQKDDVSLNQFFASAIAARVGAEDLYERLAQRLEARLAPLARVATSR